MQLSGKTCVVTGGNRGIGLELVRQLLARNNTVVATARKPSAAADLQALQASSGGRLTVTELDVAEPQSIEHWADAVEARVRHVDVIFNNAGVTDRWKGLHEVTYQDLVHCYAVNAVGPLLVVQQLHQRGLLGGSGGESLVANVTSKMGSIDDNGSGSDYAYRASKAALNIINKSLSIDLADEGVTCVLLHPGYVQTAMVDFTGNISTETCVKGLLGVLESGRELQGRWWDWQGKEVPW